MVNQKINSFAIAAITFSLFTANLTIAQPHPHQHQNHTNSHANHQHGKHNHTAKPGPHGGTIHEVSGHRIEMVIVTKGIMFVVLDKNGKTIANPDASGSVTLKVGKDTKEYPYKMQLLKNNAIGVSVDLSNVIGHTLHMNVTLNNIASSPIKFHAMGKVAEEKLSDALLIKLQGTCPVSGKPLGSMGAPPKILIDGKPLFVCCAGCNGQIKRSPKQYITKYYHAKGDQVRPGVYKATLADADFIAAQKICPVMDEKLGGMGAPLKVDVKGKAVYICCAGCAKKLNAHPEQYLAKLSKMGVKPPSMHQPTGKKHHVE